MFLGLVDTRDQRPDPDKREPLWLDIPELRPWRWYVLTVVSLVLAGYAAPWLGVILVTVGLCSFFHGITSYYQGNDGMSKHRQ
jgi:hypothetical protein